MKPMQLVSVYSIREAALYLYALLVERPADANISHRRLPTVGEHLAFMRSRPYAAWYLIKSGPMIVGSIYLTRADEIGIFTFREHQRKGYAKRAIAELRRRHPRRQYLANINPSNGRSIALFRKLGFVHLQSTFSANG